MLQKITALRLQKKKKGQRISVYLDGKYAFGLQAPIAAALKVGQMLSEEEIDQLRQNDAVEIAYDQTLDFLSYRPRSRAEIEAYLKRRKASSTAIQTIVGRLVEAGLLDDDAFAQYWIENRELFRPRGIRSLRFELRCKGVPDTVIDKAIKNINEAESAYRAACERARRLGHLDYQLFRRRLGGFLQRRGFDYELIQETVERLWQELQLSTKKEPL